MGDLGRVPAAGGARPDHVRADDRRKLDSTSGPRGILQGTYETLVSCAKKHFGGSLEGRVLLTSGAGHGWSPAARRDDGGRRLLIVEAQESRLRRRLDTGYLDVLAADLDDALARVGRAAAAKQAVSIGLVGNAGDVLPDLLRRGFNRTS